MLNKNLRELFYILINPYEIIYKDAVFKGYKDHPGTP